MGECWRELCFMVRVGYFRLAYREKVGDLLFFNRVNDPVIVTNPTPPANKSMLTNVTVRAWSEDAFSAAQMLFSDQILQNYYRKATGSSVSL